MDFRKRREYTCTILLVHIAFNAGPRSCLDRNISFVQMKIVVIALLWNFKVQVVEGHHVSPSVSVVLHMKHGLKVKVTKR